MKKSLYLLIFIPVLGWGALSKLYPTSNVVIVRLSAYQDGLDTIYKSSDDIHPGTWDIVGGSFTYISSTQPIFGYTALFSSFTYNVDGSTTANWDIEPATWTIPDFIHLIQQEQKIRDINDIVDQDEEIEMVWPDTTTFPDAGTWSGWCNSIVNGKNVPIVCP